MSTTENKASLPQLLQQTEETISAKNLRNTTWTPPNKASLNNNEYQNQTEIYQKDSWDIKFIN